MKGLLAALAVVHVATASPNCSTITACAFQRQKVAFEPSAAIYDVPVQCTLPPSLIYNISSNASSWIDLTLTSPSNAALLSASFPWTDDVTPSAYQLPPDFGLNEYLDVFVSGNALPSGTYQVNASFQACADDVASSQCDSSLCVSFVDVWPPISTEECPSYLSISKVNIDGIEYFTHLKGPFDEDKWTTTVDSFLKWSRSVHNFPCVAEIDSSRCDSYDVVVIPLGLAGSSTIKGTEGDFEQALRQVDTPNPIELETLRGIALAADLKQENPFPDAAYACTKCVQATRVLKEWVSPDFCANDHSSESQCIGDESCTINHCVTWVPIDLFNATLGVQKRYVDLTNAAKSTLPHFESSPLYNSATDTYQLFQTVTTDKVIVNLDDLVQVTSDDRQDWLATQARWSNLNATDSSSSGWGPLQGSKVYVEFVNSTEPWTGAVTVRTWTACGQIASKQYLLTIFRVQGIPIDMLVQENVLSSGMVLGVLLLSVGVALWSTSGYHPQNEVDDDIATYLLIDDSDSASSLL
ncbi:hypothetical protein LEN26_015661 [Aphanomyces euteiches]|nr:hypothetical protein LEN26_015661 [Aphanomyces euteiches]KAH9124160.1 hypothetical protein AeMF1_005024 [Aphanomyces euteiches]KAH9185528.1 hypothetical protein AeNC1_012495 [Aphanomyces euteiches]